MLEEERRVQAKELETQKDRMDELLEEKAMLEEDRQVHATELEAKKNRIEDLVEEKTKLERLLEEERQVQATELEAVETKTKELAEEKLKLEKLLEAAGEASDEGAALGSRLEEVRGVLAVVEREKELAVKEVLELKTKVAGLEESKEVFEAQLEEKEELMKAKGKLESDLKKATGEVSEIKESLSKVEEECRKKAE